MTEQQHTPDPFLSELLHSSEALAARPQVRSGGHTELSSRDVFSLMREANSAGTPTLAPTDNAATAPSDNTGETLVSELVDFVRRHPVPTLIAAVGVAYVFTRRRS